MNAWEVKETLTNQPSREGKGVEGMILFRVKATWANRGREGGTDCIVAANNAIEALQQAWKVEDPEDLRDVTIEWLTPTDCVVNRDAIPTTPEREHE